MNFVLEIKDKSNSVVENVYNQKFPTFDCNYHNVCVRPVMPLCV